MTGANLSVFLSIFFVHVPFASHFLLNLSQILHGMSMLPINSTMIAGPYWLHPYFWSWSYYKFFYKTQDSIKKFMQKFGNILWTHQYLEAQGYKIKTNIVYQDNMITLSLVKNGYVSSSKRTKHIKAKYFFIRHFHNTGELDLQYCPTEQM